MFCKTLIFFSLSIVGLLGSPAAWPNPTGSTKVPKTNIVAPGAVFDGKLQRFVSGFGGGDQTEGQKPLFELGAGATIRNVVIGAPAADGIHCLGSCTIENCWWEDVGEDAATFLGKDGDIYNIIGGGAKNAFDKVFQHNGGGTVKVKDFVFQDCGKGYRSCGNCKYNGFPRHVIMENIKVIGNLKVLAGVNGNYGDTADLKGINVAGKVGSLCENFVGTNNNKAEPIAAKLFKLGEAGDGKVCNFLKTDILGGLLG